MVTLLIGKDEEAILADKSILCKGVEFFRAAIKGCFKEGLTQILKLPEEEPSTVKIVLLWIYRGSQKDCLPVDKKDITYEDVLKVYLLSEKWMLRGLMEATYSALCQRLRELREYSDYHRAWSLAQDSTIRFLYVMGSIYLIEREVGAEFMDSSHICRDYLGDNLEFVKDAFICQAVLGFHDLCLSPSLTSFLKQWKEYPP
ncbi:hypothetical protein MMC10_002822 [Thelotrema lepadinum]|nr:hypothetical protein [Thelotrema lepadinum]